MKTAFEYIVVGCGGIGSAAVYWLSREAGREVLGIEQFELGHERGGSEDHSRIIRHSYHAPEYTALTPHSYDAWEEVEQESGVRLVVKTGGLDLEPVDGQRPEYINHNADAMRGANIPFEELSSWEVMERWPQFRLDDSVQALYQADGGLVDAGKANAAHTSLGRTRGATILENTLVRSIRPLSDGVEVTTSAGTFSGRRLLVAAGAWTNKVLGHVGVELPITLTQEQVTYYKASSLRDFDLDRFPVWIWHGGLRDTFYGFPVYGEPATKAGQDAGGDKVTVETRTFRPDPRLSANLKNFLEQYIPGALGPELYTKTCMYDLPPDRDFVLDTLPEYPQISVAIGAGHAFKFASLFGRILGELATTGKTSYPIRAFRMDRPALTDPSTSRSL